MNQLSTIPITLDPDIYTPQALARSKMDLKRSRSRSITLAPAIYHPRSATDQSRPPWAKDLPPIPKSPWPSPRAQTERTEDVQRRPWRDKNLKVWEQHASEMTRSVPPSRRGTFHTDEDQPQGRAFPNPPSRKTTLDTAPPCHSPMVREDPTPRQSNISRLKSAPTSPRPVLDGTLIPASNSPSRSSTLVEEPLPFFEPPSNGNAFQTRYMDMLLSLDKIPRLHNILASFFAWIMLAGFIVFPGTFTSLVNLRNAEAVQATPGAGDVLHTVQSLPLTVVAVVCCVIGYVGNLWLSIRWRTNYVWLLNRLYMPGTLNALAGLISTLTNVYSQHNGSWSVSAEVAVVMVSVTLVLYLALFILYNNWLLERVKEQHNKEIDFKYGSRTFKGKMEKMAKQPPVAPGSVV